MKLCRPNAHVLLFPVRNAQFVSDTDASDCDISGVLNQLIPITDDNRWLKYEERVFNIVRIAYMKRIREAILHYSQRTTCSKVWLMRYFRTYLYGQKLIV